MGNFNFNLPVDTSRLQNERLKLVPLESNLDAWAETIAAEVAADPVVVKYMPYPPINTTQEYLDWYNMEIRPASSVTLYAVLLKAGEVQKLNAETNQPEVFRVPDDTLAGVMGYLQAEPQHSAVAIGHFMIFPRFQRTFVGSHGYHLLLHHALDPLPQDLGMRRVVWQANASNTRSVNAAKRLGFHWEGVMRWERVLPREKVATEGCEGLEGKGLPVTDKNGHELGPGRHTALLSICWDDWLNGGREKVDSLLRR